MDHFPKLFSLHNFSGIFWDPGFLFLVFLSESSFFFFNIVLLCMWAQMVKNQPATWETWVQSLGQEDPLEKEMATHSSILA